MSDPISFIKSSGGGVNAAVVDQMGYQFARNAMMAIVNASGENKIVPAMVMDGYYLDVDGSIGYQPSYGTMLVNPIPLKYGKAVYFGLKRTGGGYARLTAARVCEYTEDGTFLAYDEYVNNYTPQSQSAAYVAFHFLKTAVSDASYIFAGYDQNDIFNDDMAEWTVADAEARALLSGQAMVTKDEDLEDADDATPGIHFVGANTPNAPVVGAGMLLDYYNPSNPNYNHYQMFVEFNNLRIHVRNYLGSAWSEWSSVSVVNPFYEPIPQSNISDANAVTESGMYWCGPASGSSGATVNTPGDFAGCLLHFRSSNRSNANFRTYQIFMRYNVPGLWWRNLLGTEWSEWTMVPSASTMSFGVTNIAWFGDSISALKTLPDDVAAGFGAVVHDCSCPGATLVDQTSGNKPYEDLGFKGLMNAMSTGDYTAQDQAVADLADRSEFNFTTNLNNFKGIDWSEVDTAVVMYGTNDYYNAPITIDAFKSGFKSEIATLMQKEPHVRVFVITPMYREDGGIANGQGKVLTDYVDAILEVCREVNIPCFDLYHGSNVNEYTSDTYLADDGLHQNATGNVLLTEKIYKFLMSN